MSPRKLSAETTFADLESEVMFTIAGRGADPDARALLGETADWLGWIDTAQKEDRVFRQQEATVEATRLRLRPILMTSIAFVVGLLPLTVASGAGSVGNRTIGTAAVGGMVLGTIFGALLVPGLYVLIRAGLRERPAAPPEPTEVQPAPIESGAANG